MNSILIWKLAMSMVLVVCAGWIWSVLAPVEPVINNDRFELARGAANYLIPGHAIEWREDAGGGVTITTLFAQDGKVVYLIDGRPVDRETFYRWLDDYALRQDRAKEQP